MDTPPEDSIFSIPIWKKGFNDPNASRVQMNPAQAYSQGEVKSKTAPVSIAVSMLLVAVITVLGSAVTLNSQPRLNVSASFDLTHAIVGEIARVDRDTNSFLLNFSSTQDPQLVDTTIGTWTVKLPPGEGFGLKKKPIISVCHSVSDIQGNLNQTTAAPCEQVIKAGQKAVVEYLILKKETVHMIAKKIILEIK